jgi:hypothetical protein
LERYPRGLLEASSKFPIHFLKIYSTDANHLVLKVRFVIAEAMDQNVVALHAANRMLDKDADLTQGGIDSLLHRAHS